MRGVSRPSDAADCYKDLFKIQDQRISKQAASGAFATSALLLPDDRELLALCSSSMEEVARCITTPDYFKILGLPSDAG